MIIYRRDLRSNLIPLLQSEEGCPKGGVVGEKEFLFYD